MKCKLLNCEEEAQSGFQCCTSLHGLMYKVAKENIKEILSANTRKEALRNWNWYFDKPTVEDYEYYA